MRCLWRLIRICLLVFWNLNYGLCQPLVVAEPESTGMDSKKLAQLDSIIECAIQNGNPPGAVLLVGHHGKIVYRKAFGLAQVLPDKKPMTVDHLFDLASLTKPIVTASAIIHLVENGQITLSDEVKKYLPEFSDYKYDSIQPAAIAHLLTHTAGLPAYLNTNQLRQKYAPPCPDSLIMEICRTEKRNPAGKKFQYSCPGYILLGEIVQRVTGQSLAEYIAKNFFQPLKMQNTMFLPSDSLDFKIAATEVINGKPLVGTVHDPLAQFMGGISGNAGLFSTADDLAVFIQMLLQNGTFNDTEILSPQSVALLTQIYLPSHHAKHALGWDVDSPYASLRGSRFSKDGFGHTGYTGTSIWADRPTQTFIILLTNRVHPDDKGSVVRLRKNVADAVAEAIITPKETDDE